MEDEKELFFATHHGSIADVRLVVSKLRDRVSSGELAETAYSKMLRRALISALTDDAQSAPDAIAEFLLSVGASRDNLYTAIIPVRPIGHVGNRICQSFEFLWSHGCPLTDAVLMKAIFYRQDKLVEFILSRKKFRQDTFANDLMTNYLSK